MKERPILYSGPMVRAKMAGLKTQTRRIVKPQAATNSGLTHYDGCLIFEHDIEAIESRCPYGQPGDRLWTRETHRIMAAPGLCDGAEKVVATVQYCADWAKKEVELSARERDQILARKSWCFGDTTVSIHMPRWACRLVDEIIAIRVERLQDISEVDAEAEGVDFLRRHPHADETLTAVQLYKILWESINGPGSWDLNPWVWVIEFRPVKA